jgi:hypothetical protein
MDIEEIRRMKTGRGFKTKIWVLPILFNLYGEYRTMEALESFGGFKIRGQVIRTVKYADKLVLLAKEETVLQNMFDRLIKIGRCYRMEMNGEYIKVERISR